jgi:hypothetical protein
MMAGHGGLQAWTWAYMHMIGMPMHGRHMGMVIWLHGCMRLCSSNILVLKGKCNGLGRHGSKLVLFTTRHRHLGIKILPHVPTYLTSTVPYSHRHWKYGIGGW